MTAAGPRLSIPGITPAPAERTYTQTEVEKFFAEAKSAAELFAAEIPTLGDRRGAYQFAYLQGRFGIGGAE